MTWPEAVKAMGKWYEANVHRYAADAHTYTTPPCSLLGGQGVRWDCTGYVASCLQLFGVLPRGYWISSEMGADPNGDFAKKCCKGGFKQMRYPGPSGLQPYDIVCVFEGKSKGKQHHAEIYAGTLNGKHKAWSWGNVHDGINGHQGMPCSFANYRYTICYRHDGVARDTPGFADLSSDYSGGGGSGTYIINLENYIEPYPVHSEYDTYTGNGENIFENASENAFSNAVLSSKATADASYNAFFNMYDTSTRKSKVKHTRIYSTNDAKIVLDELRIPIDSSHFDDWANYGITTTDVSAWQKEMDALKTEAKKRAEEEAAKKAAEVAANASTNSSTGNTSTNKSGNNTSTKTNGK